jgi:hypothetical protein
VRLSFYFFTRTFPHRYFVTEIRTGSAPKSTIGRDEKLAQLISNELPYQLPFTLANHFALNEHHGPNKGVNRRSLSKADLTPRAVKQRLSGLGI